MAFDPAAFSVAELRRRFLTAERPASPQLLARLARDPRRGVRALGRALDRRRRRERRERRRLDALLDLERRLWRSGIERLAGVDEAGVGPLAGPVVAAAVVFPPGTAIAGVDDSKRLAPEVRGELAREIREQAAGVGVGIAAVEEIDRLNVYQASLLAMRRAVEALPARPQHLLVDARAIPDLAIPQDPIAHGDALAFSIAAASIVAKTHRDRLMAELDARYPRYGFARHKGYATAEHQAAIRRFGPSPAHRRSYAAVGELCGGYSARFCELEERLAAIDGPPGLARFGEALERARAELAADEHRTLHRALSRRLQAL